MGCPLLSHHFWSSLLWPFIHLWSVKFSVTLCFVRGQISRATWALLLRLPTLLSSYPRPLFCLVLGLGLLFVFPLRFFFLSLMFCFGAFIPRLVLPIFLHMWCLFWHFCQFLSLVFWELVEAQIPSTRCLVVTVL